MPLGHFSGSGPTRHSCSSAVLRCALLSQPHLAPCESQDNVAHSLCSLLLGSAFQTVIGG